MTESVRGLVFGSPEYVAIAKRGELVAQADEIIDEIKGLTERLANMDADLSAQHHIDLREVRHCINEMIGEYYEF